MYKYLITFFLLLPFVASANATQDNLRRAAAGTGLATDKDPIEILVDVINVILYLVGSIFIVLIIWSGFRWMTSAGNTDSIKKAKETIINSVVGLLIIFVSYAVMNFVIDNLIDITGAGGGNTPAASSGQELCPGAPGCPQN